MHFRSELSCEKDLNDEYRELTATLDRFNQDVNLQIKELNTALQQIDKYQHDIQMLKQKLVQEEQLLKTMTPDHPADNVQVRVWWWFLIVCLKSFIITDKKQFFLHFLRVITRPLSLHHSFIYLSSPTNANRYQFDNHNNIQLQVFLLLMYTTKNRMLSSTKP